jgi:hypothetical protein
MFFVTTVVCPGLSWIMYETISRLVVAGWTVPSSSDGTTYNASGNVFTNGHLYGQNTITPGSPLNGNAWWRLRHPLGSCELLFHHHLTTNADAYTVRYSVAGFTGGAPDATTPPTATDQVYVFGDTGSFQNIIAGTSTGRFGRHVVHHVVGDADEDYAWAVFGTQNASPDTQEFLWFFDRVTGLEDPLDDSTVVGFAPCAAIGTLLNGGDFWTPAGSTARAFSFMSEWSSRQLQMRVHSLIVPSLFPSNASPFLTGANPYTGLVEFHPGALWWWRRPVGATMPANTTIPSRSPLKGRSRLFYGPFSASFGTHTPMYVTRINDAFLPVRLGNTVDSGTVLLRWQLGVPPRW